MKAMNVKAFKARCWLKQLSSFIEKNWQMQANTFTKRNVRLSSTIWKIRTIKSKTWQERLRKYIYLHDIIIFHDMLLVESFVGRKLFEFLVFHFRLPGHSRNLKPTKFSEVSSLSNICRYSETCLKRTPLEPIFLSALDRWPLWTGYVFETLTSKLILGAK